MEKDKLMEQLEEYIGEMADINNIEFQFASFDYIESLNNDQMVGMQQRIKTRQVDFMKLFSKIVKFLDNNCNFYNDEIKMVKESGALLLPLLEKQFEESKDNSAIISFENKRKYILYGKTGNSKKSPILKYTNAIIIELDKIQSKILQAS